MNTTSLLALLALLAMLATGAGIALQGPVNAALARESGGGTLLATCLSFLVGFVALTVLVLARGPVPSATALAGVPAWAWTGGLLGAVYVAALAWAVPVLGVVTTIAAAVLGQMAAGLAVDALGAFGLPVHAATPTRLAAVALVGAGLVLSRLG